MTQYEQENHLGRGGGEVDAETHEQAWRDADERNNRSPEADEGDEQTPDRGEKQA